ncbi:hypothetical protein DMC64_14955 [Amycolatopsis sp. WAC 04197]|uniref:hypothetical protein n=1 Tax=Amycolatopsis sp. WAC 04197 TaxID=2203199 RepID=UPI000F786411|nr:hypothetical protein [Amycolatopsis sp. WAC 04197]RSN46039.1 hypothetical protein DMC64_14955 [Amycolatopsis sp. WAC 04197]
MTHPPQNSFATRAEPRLPVATEEPRTPAAVLIAEASARGAADARNHVRDGWSFTDPFLPAQEAEAAKEDYVNVLRQRCLAAVASARDRHLSVLNQTAPLRARRDEARQRMVGAQLSMSRLAGQEAWLREPDLDRPPAAEGDPAAEPVPVDDPVWEGETTALGIRWRVLILTGLVAALSPLHFMVYQHFLKSAQPGAAWALGISSAVLMVLGPHVTALMVRSGRATGSDGALTPAAVVLAVAWATMAIFLGMVAAAVVGVDQVRLASLDITGTTLVVTLTAGLLVGGSVSFMIGLARRHPFQEAYAENRRRFEELDAELQQAVLQLDPGFADFGAVVPESDDRQPETLIEAIQAAYRAAEYAYFDALSATMGDASFTEAVEHRLSVLRQEDAQ